MLAVMAKTLGPVVLKHGDKDILKMHSGTPIKSLLQQLEKACKDGRVQDSEGYDVGPEYSKDLPGGDYLVIMHSTAGETHVAPATYVQTAVLNAHHVDIQAGS